MKETKVVIFFLVFISVLGCKSKATDIIKSKEENVISKDFKLTVEDVFSISDGKIVITGKVNHGKIFSNESITWLDSKNKRLSAEIEEMQVFAKIENTDVAVKN
jgi:translation elongation factor EF-Tu-like GTPase